MRYTILRLVIAAVIVVFGVANLIAQPEYAWVITWYDNEQWSNIVGQEFTGCTSWHQYGYQTAYANVTYFMYCSAGYPVEFAESHAENCLDNQDNDYDGLFDFQDPDCF